MAHCNCFRDTPLSRREWLQTASAGFGAVALASLLGDKAYSAPASLGARQADSDVSGVRRSSPRDRPLFLDPNDGMLERRAIGLIFPAQGQVVAAGPIGPP